MSWDRLYDEYRKRGVVLCLGAGVSLQCGLPTWPELLQRICQRTRGISFSDIQVSGLALPAAAAVLESHFRDRHHFVEAVRTALYREFPFFPRGYPKRDVSKFVNFVKDENPTLRAIASFCGARQSGRSYGPNPRLKAVITFNLDALLQAYAVARFRTRIVRTVERPSASSSSTKTNVFHVHGFLRFDAKAGRPDKEASDAVVLTENDYFDAFNDPTGLFTYAFLFLLREYPMVFVGLSMQDDNLRRLLHYSLRERRLAYEAEGRSMSSSRALKHFAVLKRPDRKQVQGIVEESLGRLGVNTLWLSDYAEIPGHFRSLYEAGGRNWDDVW